MYPHCTRHVKISIRKHLLIIDGGGIGSGIVCNIAFDV